MLASSLIALILLIGIFGNTSYTSVPVNETNADLDCGFTDDFHKFLTSNYGNWSFDRPDIKCGAYGGKATAKDTIKNVPVIFLHGNSDVAFGRGTADGYVAWQTGFRSLATFLSGKGYQKSEMYTTTWGPANPNAAQNNSHTK